MVHDIQTDELKVGMYVILPGSWFSHSFLRNEFLITSEDQIVKIIDGKVRHVTVDFAKSSIPKQQTKGTLSSWPDTQPPAGGRIIPDLLGTVIHDKTLPPQKKAQVVKQYSAIMMKNLLESPTAGSIREAKKGISEIVDMIIADDDTAQYMLSITSHDYYTYTHSVNVGVLAVSLSKALFEKSRDHDLHELGAGFFLHDLGKVRVDINIIQKQGKLTDEEMNQMKRHPDVGYKILHETGQLTDECGKIVLQHHERVDGMGYPQALRGKEIHIYGRICSIADVFDALTTERPYRKKLEPFQALTLMKNEMMHHFQRDIFEHFVMLFKQ